MTDLAAPFEMSLNAVSKHIRVLERARLVRRRRAGREHFLTRDPRPLDELALYLDRLRAHWNERIDRLAKALEDS